MCSEQTLELRLAAMAQGHEIIDRLFDRIEAATENDDDETFKRMMRWVDLILGWEHDVPGSPMISPVSLN